MKKLLSLILMLALKSSVLAAPAESPVDPLPEPLTNNAVAVLKIHSDTSLYSFMGLGPKKTWDSVTNEAFSLDGTTGKIYSIHSVPGTAGRIGAMAAAASGRIFLVGGFVVFQGGGMAVPDVNAYDPPHDRWFRGTDMPTPVGDAVIGVYRDRYVYLVGGRSNGGLVSTVQVYDLDKEKWSTATSISGPAVFGHAGGLVGDTIIYVDGARKNPDAGGPKFIPSDECWKGKIDHHDFRKITWTKLPPHPGTARFGIAGGASERDEMIYFSGGSDNPHDYNGVGYDGKPAEPVSVTFAYNPHTDKWETLDEHTPNPTMDHRGLLVTREKLVIMGGMEAGQKVTAKTTVLPKQAVPK